MSGKKSKNEKKAIAISAIIVFVVIVAALIFTFLIVNSSPSNIQRIDLGAENYGNSSIIDLDKDSYEQMIAEKKSFVLMIDNPGCVTTANMRGMFSDFSDNLKFTYYRIMWPDTKDTNLRNYVKYFPSLVIINNGNIVVALQADSDEDAKYYNNSSDLADWLKKYIIFPE